jgi:hypothetical protein
MSARASRPVRRYGLPSYPTKVAALADPDLLRRHVPRTWLAQRDVAALAGILLAANTSGCRHSPAPPRTSLALDAPAVVAPIFAHGSGGGSTGCIVVSPPEFLSEEESLQVIREELGRAGLTSWQKNVELSDVVIPHRGIVLEPPFSESQAASQTWPDEKTVEFPEEGQCLKVDLLDTERRVAVEFVSQADYAELGGPTPRGFGSSVHDYDFKDSAAFVGQHVAGSGRGVYFGAFYDPATNSGMFKKWVGTTSGATTQPAELLALFGADREERERLAVEQSKRLLRQQVKDFVDWLKAQGAI